MRKARALNKRDHARIDRSKVEGFREAHRFVQINRIRRVKVSADLSKASAIAS